MAAAAAAAMSAQLPPHATPQGNHSHHHHHQQQHHHHHHSQQQQQLHHHHQQQQLQQQQQQSSLSQGPHLHRSAERALEDAFFSAALNLSGRKLKEFPRSGVIDFDLSDTTQADLSKNRLNEVPLEVCHFVSLESLVLYHNCIRSIPEAIVNLRSLTYLNISRNQLTTLPPYLCKLPLQVLNASNNKLVSLPEELGQLKELSALDVSCNEIQALPPQIASLTCLRDLNVRRNNLVILPDEIADLPLVQLDVSCNRLGEIPVSFRKLKQLQSLVLDNNPMKSPPAQICIKGKHHIFKYLHMEACKLDKKLADRLIRPAGSSTCLPEDFVPHKACGLLDSGFNSVDSGNKRWSGNEARSNRIKQPSDEESASTALMRGADSSRDQRLRRETPHTPLSNGLVVEEGQEVDYIEDEDEEDAVTPKAEDQPGLTTKFMAYIERRISHEKLFPLRTDETPLPRSEDEGGWRDEQSRTPTADDEQGGGGGGRVGADREAGDGALRERHRSADGSQERRRPVVYSASFCETDIRRRPISFHDARRLPQSSSFTAKDRRRPPAFVHSAPSGGHGGGGGGGGEGGGPCAPLAGILRNAGSTSASPLPGLVSNGQPGVTATDTTVYQQEDLPPAEFEFQKKREQILLERTRHEAQLARRRYEDERQRLTKHSTTQTFTATKPRGVHQHSADSDPQSDCVNVPPSRKPHHIDDSALLVSPADPVSSPDAALPKATPQPHKFTKSEEKTPTNAYSGSNAPLFGLKLRSESASVRPCSQPPHSRPSPSPTARSPPPPLSSPTHPTTPSPSSPAAAAAPPTTATAATASHAHTHSPHSPHRAAASVPASKPPGSFLFSPAGGGLLEQRLAFNSPSSAMDSFEGLDPSFTVKRKLSHVREEMELIEQLKKNIECRLKVTLPGDPVNLGSALMDGVVLCHLANHIRPRSVPSIHVPSPAVPKLTMAKCRRNVENFLEACKKMGVPQEQLCLPHHILEEKGLSKVSLTVQCLLDLATSKPSQASVV
ncbi:DISP complex protein LRCH3-like isoform X5 [Lethenteron reissneri]|uniref:DISP complex protein LRCH3-like isoform X5 n=1 Tax=Lethenteron reissneri TaxID=7753 RepID=UPI002AB7BA4C|nr:DISP complex protein LRCH3-like isoform X5 [Lethenteron reissneri]